jgi:long-subunit fatty acid transport protein
VGGAYWREIFSLHVSAEWYNTVKNYEPMVLAPLNSQSTDETFSKQITQQFKSIINAGIGLDYKLNDKVSLAGSFITDFSANDRSYQSSLSLSEWDIYHVSAGSYFKIGNSEITLGVSYSFGNDYKTNSRFE